MNTSSEHVQLAYKQKLNCDRRHVQKTLKCKTSIYRRSLSEFHETSVNRPVFFGIFGEKNDGNNLMTGFSKNKSNPLFNAGLVPAVLPWQRY